jgi:hypothetical protein
LQGSRIEKNLSRDHDDNDWADESVFSRLKCDDENVVEFWQNTPLKPVA